MEAASGQHRRTGVDDDRGGKLRGRPRSRVRHRVARALLVVLVGLCAGCGSRAARFPLHVIDAVIPREGRTHAILVNGGGRPETNYQSHLQHVKGVLALLETNGVRAADIVIFSGDGADPAADLATRERFTEPDVWLLPQTTVGSTLHPLTLVDSAVDGMTLRPARKDALRAWFATDGVRLRRGDTLLFYVTDHGRKNGADLANNSIVLWGEELSVTELQVQPHRPPRPCLRPGGHEPQVPRSPRL